MLKGGGFNPHTHEGCDWSTSLLLCGFGSFNPHTHEGCDVLLVCFDDRSLCFNPHTHEGCDFVFRQGGYSINGFQSTHPRRV